MSFSRPLLSVAIPAYNRPESVVKIARDLVPQLRMGDELLIVDDASPDDAASAVKNAFAAQVASGQLRVVRNERNLGLVGNWNETLRLAANPWIVTIHDDDLVQPDGLETLRHVIGATGQQPGIYVGGHMPPHAADPAYPGIRFRFSDAGPWAVLHAPPIPSGVTVHRSIYDAHGVYNERFHFSPDLELFPRLARWVPLIWIERPAVVVYELHAGNHQLRTWNDPAFFPQLEQILHLICDYAGLEGAAREKHFQQQMTRHLRYMLRRCQSINNRTLCKDVIQRLLKLPDSVRRRGRWIAAVTSAAGWYPGIIAR